MGEETGKVFKKYAVVAVGGTFDHIHKGHKHLLQKAFSAGNKVLIGITSDSFCKSKAYPERLQNYSSRKRGVLAYLKTSFENPVFRIIKLYDKYGPAISNKELEAIVVTEQTVKTAEEINEIRIEKGLKPLDILLADLIRAYDNTPISSTRIRKGEITQNGSRFSGKE